MSLFERYLTLWVALCIVTGIALGHWFPGLFHAIGAAEVAHVNLPVAALIWLMIIPMLVKVDFAAIGKVREHWRGIGVTLFINWAVKPFSMAAWAGCNRSLRPFCESQSDSYSGGLILRPPHPARHVFVWSTRPRRARLHLTHVALNDTIMSSPSHRSSACCSPSPVRCPADPAASVSSISSCLWSCAGVAQHVLSRGGRRARCPARRACSRYRWWRCWPRSS